MKYPTHKSGLIVPPYELGFNIPTKEELNTRRMTQNHHGYFTRRAYMDEPHRRIFRGLVTNVYPMLATEHNTGSYTLHDRYDPPKMPKDGIMIDVVDEYLALNGIIDVVHERDTSTTYQVDEEKWLNIRKGV